MYVRQIGSQVMEQSGDNRATQFLLQIAIDVQRGQTSQLSVSPRDSSFLGLFSSSHGQVLISQGHAPDLKVFAC